MLCVMHTWNGDWNEWSLLEERLRTVAPRDAYRDFDLLCLSYATFYVDHVSSARQLEAILERHPTWIVPRALLAAAWGHAAIVYENQEYARRALHEVEIPVRLAGNNPFVLVCAECVYLPAANVLTGEHAVLDQKAREYAERLADYPKNQVLTNLRALYYLDSGEAPREKRAWDDVLNYGRGFVLEEALAAHLRWGTTTGLPGFRDRGLEADTARAYIDAYYGRCDDAYAVYQQLSKKYCTWYVRYKLLQLLLLLRRENEAREACRMWLKDSMGVEHFGDWERRSIEFVAGARSPADFTRVGDPVGRFFVHYQLAYLAYARGEHAEAQRHFEECSTWTYPDERRHWARAFAIRLADDVTTLDTATTG
jgi:hypothetical protein